MTILSSLNFPLPGQSLSNFVAQNSAITASNSTVTALSTQQMNNTLSSFAKFSQITSVLEIAATAAVVYSVQQTNKLVRETNELIKFSNRILEDTLRETQKMSEFLGKPKATQAHELLVRGHKALVNGWLEDAHRDLTEAISQNPYEPLSYLYLGDVCQKQGNLVDANRLFENCLKYQVPDEFDELSFSQVSQCFHQLISLNAENGFAWNLSDEIKSWIDRWGEQFAFRSYLYVGDCYENIGDFISAESTYVTCLRFLRTEEFNCGKFKLSMNCFDRIVALGTSGSIQSSLPIEMRSSVSQWEAGSTRIFGKRIGMPIGGDCLSIGTTSKLNFDFSNPDLPFVPGENDQELIKLDLFLSIFDGDSERLAAVLIADPSSIVYAIQFVSGEIGNQAAELAFKHWYRFYYFAYSACFNYLESCIVTAKTDPSRLKKSPGRSDEVQNIDLKSPIEFDDSKIMEELEELRMRGIPTAKSLIELLWIMTDVHEKFMKIEIFCKNLRVHRETPVRGLVLSSLRFRKNAVGANVSGTAQVGVFSFDFFRKFDTILDTEFKVPPSVSDAVPPVDFESASSAWLKKIMHSKHES